MENQILASIIKDRECYEKIHELLEAPKRLVEFSIFGELILGAVADYYASDPDVRECSIASIKLRCGERVTNPKHVARINTVLDNLPAAVSSANVARDILLLRRSRVGEELSYKLANKVDDGVTPLMEEYLGLKVQAESSDEVDVISGRSVRDIVASYFREAGLIRLHPQPLNDAIGGGLRPGHNVLVYARPEMGKTLLVLDNVAGMLRDGVPVLYVANEEPVVDLLMRIVGRIAGLTRKEIIEEPDEAMRMAEAGGYSNLYMYEASPGTFGQIERLIIKTGAKVAVLDQVRNIDTGEDNRVVSLEKAVQKSRNLGKKLGTAMINVTQAGESAEGKLYLDLSDVDYSKTGMQGAVDLQIGIGSTPQWIEEGVRGISLPKNKIGGEHSRFQCRFNKYLGTVEMV